MKKRKILWLSDHPLVPSGVGIQAKLVIEGLIRTGLYEFVCFGGAIKHPDYTPQIVAPEIFGNSWVIHPVDGHGRPELMRKFIREEKPDAVVIFTDPRFFTWVWEMEDEIRPNCPLIYWHVWDNDPTPVFNRMIYDCTDFIVPLSLKTKGILDDLKYPEDRYLYVPHAVPSDIFKPIDPVTVEQFRRENYGRFADRKFILMWNNRNARRKMTGDVMESFARFSRKVGRDNVALFMHTASDDQEGQDIKSVAKHLKIEDILMLSEGRVEPENMNLMYNSANCVINISSNEGFGLGTLEAISAGIPIVVNMTGGLQFQIGDWWCDQVNFSDQDRLTKIARSRMSSHRWWGVPVFPAARNLVGSQTVPYIYDDRVNDQDVAAALEKVYRMSPGSRRKMGEQARDWVQEKFSMGQMITGWQTVFDRAIKNFNEKSRGSIHLGVI